MIQSSPNPPGYQPQMDGLRALAVIGVLLHHLNGPFHEYLSFGTLGVRYFFVTSGFLITRILFRSREKCEAGKANWQRELGIFQMRRLIRTLPTYYLFIIIALLLGIQPVRETLAWTLTFLTNFYIASLGYFPDTISHFWSLAVQEQFYFFWPFLIYFLPKAFLRPIMFLLIAVAVGFRLYCIRAGASEFVRWFNLLGNLDSFAIGGLLAHFSLRNPTLIVRRRTRVWTGCLAFGAFLLANRLRVLPQENHLSIWVEVLEATTMGWFVACSVAGFRGVAGRVLSWPPLTYIGRVSYGIYVYHVLVAILLVPTIRRFGLDHLGPAPQTGRFFLEVGVAVLVSSLSWHFFEQPLLRLREPLERWLLPKKG